MLVLVQTLRERQCSGDLACENWSGRKSEKLSLRCGKGRRWTNQGKRVYEKFARHDRWRDFYHRNNPTSHLRQSWKIRSRQISFNLKFNSHHKGEDILFPQLNYITITETHDAQSKQTALQSAISSHSGLEHLFAFILGLDPLTYSSLVGSSP